MKTKRFILFLAILLVTSSLYAGPAKRGAVCLQQPDGTVFDALIKGDEFVRIKTTTDGHAIIQEDDGWWCYAFYDADGRKRSSGWKIGFDAPQEVLQASAQVPFKTLAQAARDKRIMPDENEPPVMKRLRPDTRSDNSETIVRHALVILAEFKDVAFRYSQSDFERLLNEEDYSENGATGSVKQYFDAQFDGKVVFDFDLSPIVTLVRTRAYYGANDPDGDDKAPAEMIKDACEAADSNIDFSIYDDDGDGKVDNVFVFFAGADEADGADEECIWSHAWYLKSGAGLDLILDGKRIDRYACTSELARIYSVGKVQETISGIGTFCHEYSHTLGLPDFYDTDYEKAGGWAAGLWGSTSLMDSGNQNNGGNTPPYFNAIEREILGLAQADVLNAPGTYSLEPISESNRFYRIDTDSDDEYYLLECRSEDDWDAHIGGSGMLVYHIDKSAAVIDRWNYYNNVNSDHSHQCADMIEADSRSDAFSDDNDYSSRIRNIRGVFFPTYTVNFLESLGFWSGARSPFSLTSIRRTDAGITFSLINEDDSDGPPAVADMNVFVSSDAAIVRFAADRPYDGKAHVRWGRTGRMDNEIEVDPYQSGKYYLMLEDLEPQGKTYTVEVQFIKDDVEGESKDISFMTRSRPPVKWPYIYLTGVERNEDGSFPKDSRLPLMLGNADGAEAVEWYMNDIPVTHEGDGYLSLTENGILKAVVYWRDGRTDVVAKEIILK